MNRAERRRRQRAERRRVRAVYRLVVKGSKLCRSCGELICGCCRDHLEWLGHVLGVDSWRCSRCRYVAVLEPILPNPAS